MTDALSALRQAIIAGTAVSHANGFYTIGSQRFPEATKTSFKRTLAKSDDYYYTLRDIMFFRENAVLVEYRRKVVEAKLVAVVEQDRAALQSYLEGKINSCPQINTALVTDAGVGEGDGAHSGQRQSALPDDGSSAKATSSSGAAGISTDKAEKNKSHKRKGTPLSPSEQTEEMIRRKAEIEADRQALKKLREGDLSSISRSGVFRAPVGTDFRNVLKIFNDAVLKPADLKEAQLAAQKEVAKNNESGASSQSSSSFLIPIIIVPSPITSCITAQNVEELLIQGIFVPSDERQYPTGGQRMRERIINRPRLPDGTGGGMYKIIDDASKLTDKDWDRVVAVFVTGQLWQFRNWKYSNPAELFNHILGIHLTTEGNLTVDANVKSWNCRVLHLAKNKEHLNAASIKSFWVALDQYVSVRKPHFKQQSMDARKKSTSTAAAASAASATVGKQ